MSDPQADCEALLNMLLPFAEQQLGEHGSFHPFGGAIAPDGEFVPVAAYDGRDDPPSTEIVAFLKESLRDGAAASRYVATAIIYDSLIDYPAEDTPALSVLLDHRDGFSVVVYFPYRLANGAVTLAESFHQDGPSDIFPSRAP